jgi:hypothetical protein
MPTEILFGSWVDTSMRVALVCTVRKIVHNQSPITKQPGKCSFNDPDFWLLAPSALSRATFDDFELPARQ